MIPSPQISINMSEDDAKDVPRSSKFKRSLSMGRIKHRSSEIISRRNSKTPRDEMSLTDSLEIPSLKKASSIKRNLSHKKSESDSFEGLNSPDSKRKNKTNGKSSNKTPRKNKNKHKGTRLMDNIQRLVASMYENSEDFDQRIFLFEKKENDNIVVYMNENDPDYNEEFPAIKGAILEKLITGLTPENYFDQDYTFSFLLNYRSFTNAKTLLELLALRWNLPQPQRPTKAGRMISKEDFEKKLKPIRLRIYNVLKMWIEDHGMDIDSPTKTLLTNFINDVVAKDMPSASNSLIKLLNNPKERDNFMFNMKPPMPIIPMNLKDKLAFSDLHPEEIARQLTLIDSNLFRKIRPQEFLNSGWTKTDKEQRSPGIIASINCFNHISNWVASEIVLQKDLKSRAMVLSRFICAAQKCYELHNFNSLMAIIAALHNSAVYRLYDTWEIIPQKLLDLFKFLSSFMNCNEGEGNFHDYREGLKTTVPPLVPYLGLCLTDLIFISEGNKDYLDEEKNIINYQKMIKIGKVVRNITIMQQQPYCLDKVDFIQDYILSYKVLDEQQQYQESISREKKIPKSQRALLSKDRSKEVKRLKIDLKLFNIND